MERYRFYDDCAIYYVTFTVADWLPVFISDAAFQIVTQSLRFCHDTKSLRTNAYVIMPTHLHAIVFDADWQMERLQQTLMDLRKFTGRQLADHCTAHLPHCFTQALRHAAPNDRERRFWQATRHPVALTSEAMWKQKLLYLHDNPCRKGLVRKPADWRYSSAQFYLAEGQQTADVPISRLEWD